MNWSSMQDFLSMGGYAPYVWGAIGMVAACIVIETVLLGRRWRRARSMLQRRGAGEQP